jgi:hypothetical protein
MDDMFTTLGYMCGPGLDIGRVAIGDRYERGFAFVSADNFETHVARRKEDFPEYFSGRYDTFVPEGSGGYVGAGLVGFASGFVVSTGAENPFGRVDYVKCEAKGDKYRYRGGSGWPGLDDLVRRPFSVSIKWESMTLGVPDWFCATRSGIVMLQEMGDKVTAAIKNIEAGARLAEMRTG